MRKEVYFHRKRLKKRIQAIVIIVALTVTNLTTPMKASQATGISYQNDISAALRDVTSGMGNKETYEEAVNKLSTSLDNLQGASTVEGFM